MTPRLLVEAVSQLTEVVDGLDDLQCVPEDLAAIEPRRLNALCAAIQDVYTQWNDLREK